MIKLVSEITIIKNKHTLDPGKKFLSNVFDIPFTQFQGVIGVDNLSADLFKDTYEKFDDVAFKFSWVNDVSIESSFKKLTKTAKIKFPRNLNFGGLVNILRTVDKAGTTVPIFGRGDRIIIKMGYEWPNSELYGVPTTKLQPIKEVFRGYISRVNLGTPLELECEDQMFALKRMAFKFNSAISTEELTKKTPGKISLINFLKRMLLMKNNTLLKAQQDVFDFEAKPNTLTTKTKNGKIPVVISEDIPAFTWNTKTDKSFAETFVELKKKLNVNVFFDDFGNLHFFIPQINYILLQRKPITFFYENQIIKEDNMKFQKKDDVCLKVIVKSDPLKKGEPPKYANGPPITSGPDKGKPESIGYIGDETGDVLSENTVLDMSQAELDAAGLRLYNSNVYTGYAKESNFTTFGEGAVMMGDRVNLISSKYEEKNGTFEVVSVKREYGIKGYQQVIEIGPLLGLSQGQVDKIGLIEN